MKKRKNPTKHIDVLRRKTGSAADYDWRPTVGPAFRLRDETGAFQLDSGGKEKMMGRR
jgi:hypothetical protein